MQLEGHMCYECMHLNQQGGHLSAEWQVELIREVQLQGHQQLEYVWTFKSENLVSYLALRILSMYKHLPHEHPKLGHEEGQ